MSWVWCKREGWAWTSIGGTTGGTIHIVPHNTIWGQQGEQLLLQLIGKGANAVLATLLSSSLVVTPLCIRSNREDLHAREEKHEKNKRKKRRRGPIDSKNIQNHKVNTITALVARSYLAFKGGHFIRRILET